MISLADIQPFNTCMGEWNEDAKQACKRLHDMLPVIMAAMEFTDAEKEELCKLSFGDGWPEWLIGKTTKARSEVDRILGTYMQVCENAYYCSKDASERAKIAACIAEYQSLIDSFVRAALAEVAIYAMACLWFIQIVEDPHPIITLRKRKQFRLMRVH
jgi:hypothetical protein